MTIDPSEIPVPQMHAYLLGAVTPRPIAFASTVDEEGNVNLSPFSFFNCFGANPPVVVFSPARRGRDSTTKHTYENVREVPEVVIHIVTYDMVQQVSLASAEFPRGVNEFVKAGFTPVESVKVRPPRVAESPVAMECRVTQIISTGDKGAAGNLVICEVILMHIDERVLGADGRIDPWKLDAVARLGGDYYSRVNGESIFRVPRPLDRAAIGMDQLPDKLRLSDVLTGNELAMLANVVAIPTLSADDPVRILPEVREAMAKGTRAVHMLVRNRLAEGQIEEAWKIVLALGA